MSLKQIRDLIIENAVFYDAPMNEIKLKLYAEVLQSESVEKLAEAFKHFRHKPGQKFLPMPADILAFCNPKGDPDSDAREAAARIVQAVGKFGYMQGSAASKFIGSLGWRVVERIGGWQYLCENLGTNIDVTTFTAQARDLCKATWARGDLNDTPPELPPPGAPRNSLEKAINWNSIVERKKLE